MARKCAREINGCSVDKISNLDTVLGIKWNERILNTNGDFAYVYRQTVSFWLVEKKPITEYKYFGDSLIESAIENDTNLIFHFVRGDGVKAEYTSGEWK